MSNPLGLGYFDPEDDSDEDEGRRRRPDAECTCAEWPSSQRRCAA
jgi:hypothetical protein